MNFVRINIILIILAGTLAACPYEEDTCEVLICRVIDGDTYLFYNDSTEYRVRVLDFDAFETKASSRLKKQMQWFNMTKNQVIKKGLLQKRKAENYILNKKVLLIRDRKQPNTDSFGRLLRRVYYNGQQIQILLN